MKKTLLLFTIILIVVLFSACKTGQKEEIDMIKFESGNYFNKDWADAVGTYKEAAVPNKNVALEIAKSIFNGMAKSKEAQEYIPQYVFYDEQDEIWIVSFWKESDDTTLGGDCSIAIQKADGKVLRIWFGE